MPQIRPLRSSLLASVSFWLGTIMFVAAIAMSIVDGLYLNFDSRTDALGTLGMCLSIVLVCASVARFLGKEARAGCLVSLGLAFAFFFVLLRPVLSVAHNAAIKMLAASHLRRIAVAMKEFDKEQGHLPPPALVDNDGCSLLSWRVLILPYLGGEERSLYQRFHLNEPWDRAHNRELLAAMPRVYEPPTGIRSAPYTTLGEVFVGKGTPFEPGRPVTFKDIENADGLNNTILVVSTGPPVPWTKPEDIPFAEDQPLAVTGALVHLRGEGRTDYICVATADGGSRQLPPPVNPKAEKELRGRITWSGGEKLDPDFGHIP